MGGRHRPSVEDAVRALAAVPDPAVEAWILPLVPRAGRSAPAARRWLGAHVTEERRLAVAARERLEARLAGDRGALAVVRDGPGGELAVTTDGGALAEGSARDHEPAT